MRKIAETIGWIVIALAVLGLVGVGDFRLTFGPPKSTEKVFECVDGDSILNRRRYLCDEDEHKRKGWMPWLSRETSDHA